MLRKTQIAVALLATSQGVFAQQLPGAGGQLQQIPPPPVVRKSAPELSIVQPGALTPVAAEGQIVRVNSLRITGNSVFSEAELIAATGFKAGSDWTLGQLRQAAMRISAHYHQHGHFLTQAYLPAQGIENGAVTIAVVEGRYGKVDLRNSSTLKDRVARNILEGLDSGDLVTNAPLERRLLLLSDIPGVAIKSTLAPGTAVGTSDLLVDVVPGRRFSGSIEADNAGNRYTGTYRAGGTINFNNPTGNGDMLSLRLLASAGGLAYGRASYQAPVGDATVGVAFTHLRYQLGREFEDLDGEGSADIASIYASYPILRSRDANLYLLAGVDGKKLHDEIGIVSVESDKRILVGSIGIAGNSQDDFGGGGATTFSAGLSLGDLDIQSPLEREVDALTARSDGTFGKYQASVARLQRLSGPLSLYAAVRGQVAFENLDSSEKIQLGGAYGVRAYPEGEAYGDHGYIATLEARLALNAWASSLPGQFELVGFVDTGEVQYAQDPWFTGSNHVRLSGIGGGLNWAGPHDLFIKVSYATKLSDHDATSGPDKSGRAWFQIVKLF